MWILAQNDKFLRQRPGWCKKQAIFDRIDVQVDNIFKYVIIGNIDWCRDRVEKFKYIFFGGYIMKLSQLLFYFVFIMGSFALSLGAMNNKDEKFQKKQEIQREQKSGSWLEKIFCKKKQKQKQKEKEKEEETLQKITIIHDKMLSDIQKNQQDQEQLKTQKQEQIQKLQLEIQKLQMEIQKLIEINKHSEQISTLNKQKIYLEDLLQKKQIEIETLKQNCLQLQQTQQKVQTYAQERQLEINNLKEQIIAANCQKMNAEQKSLQVKQALDNLSVQYTQLQQQQKNIIYPSLFQSTLTVNNFSNMLDHKLALEGDPNAPYVPISYTRKYQNNVQFCYEFILGFNQKVSLQARYGCYLYSLLHSYMFLDCDTKNQIEARIALKQSLAPFIGKLVEDLLYQNFSHLYSNLKQNKTMDESLIFNQLSQSLGNSPNKEYHQILIDQLKPAQKTTNSFLLVEVGPPPNHINDANIQPDSPSKQPEIFMETQKLLNNQIKVLRVIVALNGHYSLLLLTKKPDKEEFTILHINSVRYRWIAECKKWSTGFYNNQFDVEQDLTALESFVEVIMFKIPGAFLSSTRKSAPKLS